MRQNVLRLVCLDWALPESDARTLELHCGWIHLRFNFLICVGNNFNCEISVDVKSSQANQCFSPKHFNLCNGQVGSSHLHILPDAVLFMQSSCIYRIKPVWCWFRPTSRCTGHVCMTKKAAAHQISRPVSWAHCKYLAGTWSCQRSFTEAVIKDLNVTVCYQAFLFCQCQFEANP